MPPCLLPRQRRTLGLVLWSLVPCTAKGYAAGPHSWVATAVATQRTRAFLPLHHQAASQRTPLWASPLEGGESVASITKNDTVPYVSSVVVFPPPVVATEPPLPVDPDTAKEADQQQLARDRHVLACSLAALSGLADVACLQQVGSFANIVTGHMLKVLMAVQHQEWSVARHFGSMIVAYAVGAASWSWLQESSSHESKAPLRPVATVAALVWGVADLGPTWMRASLLAAGFGLINAAAVASTQGAVHFAMTGHLNKVCNGYWKKGSGGWSPVAQKSAHMMLSFVGGAVVALGLGRRLPPLGLTLAVLYGLVFQWYDGRQLPVSQRRRRWSGFVPASVSSG